MKTYLKTTAILAIEVAIVLIVSYALYTHSIRGMYWSL